MSERARLAAQRYGVRPLRPRAAHPARRRGFIPSTETRTLRRDGDGARTQRGVEEAEEALAGRLRLAGRGTRLPPRRRPARVARLGAAAALALAVRTQLQAVTAHLDSPARTARTHGRHSTSCHHVPPVLPSNLPPSLPVCPCAPPTLRSLSRSTAPRPRLSGSRTTSGATTTPEPGGRGGATSLVGGWGRTRGVAAATPPAARLLLLLPTPQLGSLPSAPAPLLRAPPARAAPPQPRPTRRPQPTAHRVAHARHEPRRHAAPVHLPAGRDAGGTRGRRAGVSLARPACLAPAWLPG